jgi:basic membrane protein A and related proteins
VDVAVFKTIEAVQNGDAIGGDITTFGLKEEGVGLGTVSPKVPQDVLDQVDDIKQQILDGSLQIPDTVG